MKPARLLVSCLALGALAGCGNTVHHHHAPGEVVAPEPVAEAEAPVQEEVVEEEVVEEVVEVQEDEAKVVYVEIDLTPEYRRFRGEAAANFNTGYVDGWAAAAFFNRGRPLTDDQVDRLITVGRRQGDPTGKLSLPGYEAGYRCGAKHIRNPYRRRMTIEQVYQLRRAQGLPQRELVVRPGRGHGHGHGHADRDGRPNWNGRRGAERAENERKAREAELEAARLKAETERQELEAARLKRQTDRIEKIDELRDKREAARDQRKADLEAKLDAARKDRAAREAKLKAEMELARKQREEEAKRQELARKEREAKLKADLEAAKAKREAAAKEREMARDQREADLQAELEEKKEDREAKRDQRTADRKQNVADLKQRLADKKAQREAGKDAKEKAEASARD